MNLVMEKLISVIDPASDLNENGTGSLVWLQKYLKTTSETLRDEQGSRKLSLENRQTTLPEYYAMLAYDDMAHIIYEACDRERWPEPDYQETLDTFNTTLLGRLEKHLAMVENTQGVVPAFGSTLHTLYTAYEVGRMCLNLDKYLSRPLIRVHETQIIANQKVVEIALKLSQAVVEKSTIIKKGLHEGGWIDKLLECVMPGYENGTDEFKATSISIAYALKGLVDENFMEEWAGQVVESWGDSIEGLSYLKAL